MGRLGGTLCNDVGTVIVKVRVEKQIGASVFAIETGELAKQAHGSCMVQYGETVVLTAAVSADPRPGIDFFPLTCDYRERTAAAGKFPGGFIKREGRPTTKETLTARLMDRPIRPMFAPGYKDEVQIQALVVASDRQNDADVLAMNAASVSLLLAGLPFEGPLGSVRLAQVDGQFVVFPTQEDLEMSDLDLIVSGTQEHVLMIEGFAREMPEDRMEAAIQEAHRCIRDVCALQMELINKVNPTKKEYVPTEDPFPAQLHSAAYDRLLAAKKTEGKQARAEAVSALKEVVKGESIPDPAAEGAVTSEQFRSAWHDLEEKVIRDLILSGTRPDGRGPKDIRDIQCKVNLLPRVHGSAVFQRGETQSLITVTLGTGRDEQRVDGLFDEYSKRFMLDYNFPSWSVGEVRPIRGPGRREIGHGALAERSVNPIMPSPEDFPYTVRVISDILESNGSSSMASVCGATLALMAAGVPITNPVAGISIGLVQESADKWTLLTDIIGDEDHFGDMDFKIAGTQNGITGIQLDLKIMGVSEAIIHDTLLQAKDARIEILRKMLTTISRPAETTSEHAPRLLRTKVNPEKIGLLIGPGGKTIRGLQERTGTVIEVNDEGAVTIASFDEASAREAMDFVESLTGSVEVGKTYNGRVTSVKDFGAFIEIMPGKDGLCHISELADEYVSSVAEICKVGDTMKVKVIAVDEQDRVKLSRKAVLKDEAAPAAGEEEDAVKA